MAKILLVEDDNNLREIYEARLMAEGYEIVHANDGEEALVLAKKELPDLVISDVMMPRISGFEMLDIMRNTEGLQDVKVIMLTALGQAEDKGRADKLGADRYLVKSQVTLEDIVKATSELLGGGDVMTDAPPAVAAPQQEVSSTPVSDTTVPTQTPQAAPPTPTAEPSGQQIPVATPPVNNPNIPEPTPQPPTPELQPAPNVAVASTQQPAPVTPPPPTGVAATIPDPVTPPALQPSAPQNSDAGQANTDKLADAVNDLINGANTDGSTAQQQPTTAQSQTPPLTPQLQPPTTPVQPPAPQTVAPTQQPSPPTTDGASSDNNEVENDSVTIARKKIIKPLSPEFTEPQSGLDELLAKENANTDPTPMPQQNNPVMPAAAPPPPVATTGYPHPPGQIIAPGNAPQQPPANTPPVDPNSIAL